MATAPRAPRKIDVPGQPEAAGQTWSNCLVVGREIVISGVTAMGPDGRAIGGASAGQQTLAILERIGARVKAAGGSIGNIYKLVIYVTDIAGKDEVRAARAAFFKPTYPASTLVAVKGLIALDLLVEIDAFANLDIDLHADAD